MRQNERGDGRRWKMGGRHNDQEKFEVKKKLQLRRNKKIRGEENKNAQRWRYKKDTTRKKEDERMNLEFEKGQK